MTRIASRRLLAAAAAALEALLAAGASAAAPLSNNWAGYVASGSGRSFTDVRGAWTVPSVVCPARGSSYSSFWVGLGGYAPGATRLQQIGTSSDCHGGRLQTTAWYELMPSSPSSTDVDVAPGDRVSAEVSVRGATISFSLADLTTGRTFSTTRSISSPDLSSAEWIAEAPSQCSGSRCDTLPLARFGSLTFASASATANDVRGAISGPSWTADAIQLVPRVAGSASAVPGPLSTDGSSFTITAMAAPTTAAPRDVPLPPRSRQGTDRRAHR